MESMLFASTLLDQEEAIVSTIMLKTTAHGIVITNKE
jgi:hypothetical protein